MVSSLKAEKVGAFNRGFLVARRTVFTSSNNMLLSFCCFLGLLFVSAANASDGGEVSIDGKQIVTCGHGIAGAVLLADTERILTSVELQMADAPMPRGSFSVSLLADSGEGKPGAILAQLSGSEDPSAAGSYTYLANDLVVLEASRRYWIVAAVKNERSAYEIQVVEANPAIPSGGFFESFVEFGDDVRPMDASPAMFAGLKSGSNVLSSNGAQRFKFLWTMLLSAVILVCCFDLVPVKTFSFSRG